MGVLPCSLDRATVERFCRIHTLQTALCKLHRDLNTRINDRSRRAIEGYNAATSIITPQYSVSDFVVVCRATRPPHMLSFRWCGPRRVTAVTSPSVCVVEDFLTRKRETIHAARIKTYCGNLDGATVPEEVLVLADRTSANYDVVEKSWTLTTTTAGYGSVCSERDCRRSANTPGSPLQKCMKTFRIWSRRFAGLCETENGCRSSPESGHLDITSHN